MYPYQGDSRRRNNRNIIVIMWNRYWKKGAAFAIIFTACFLTLLKLHQSIYGPSPPEALQRLVDDEKLPLAQRMIKQMGEKPWRVDRKPRLLNAAIVALVRNENLRGMRSTLRQVEDRFNRNYGYKYVLLNDVPFTDEFKQGVQAMVNTKVEFGLLQNGTWGLSPYISEEKVHQKLRENQHRYIYGDNLKYRFMCRFQSGFIHKHPLLKDIDYYWRIEPDVEYYCDMPYDPFRLFKDHKFKYGYTIAPPEKPETVETLWETTKEWIRRNKHLLPKKSFASFILDNNNNYNMCHFWSNFEIVDLSLYRSEAYQSYFDFLDRAGGFFYERWGDAPVHSIAAALLLTKSQIHWFEDVGYHHVGYQHCPQPRDLHLYCNCNPRDSFTATSPCQQRYNELDDITKKELLARLGIE